MKILLIDDSSLSRRILKNALGEGYTYLEATEGMRGLELYFLEKPDLVILDLTMPGLNGLEVLEKLRAIDPQVRVIIGTADVQEFSHTQALELGAADFIHKPFRAENVAAAVERALHSDSAASGTEN